MAEKRQRNQLAIYYLKAMFKAEAYRIIIASHSVNRIQAFSPYYLQDNLGHPWRAGLYPNNSRHIIQASYPFQYRTPVRLAPKKKTLTLAHRLPLVKELKKKKLELQRRFNCNYQSFHQREQVIQNA